MEKALQEQSLFATNFAAIIAKAIRLLFDRSHDNCSSISATIHQLLICCKYFSYPLHLDSSSSNNKGMIKVSYTGQGESRKALIEVDNGDLEALTTAIKQYQLVDEQALLRYALVALLNTSDNTLYVKDGDKVSALKVNESLLKKPAQKGSASNDDQEKE